MRTRLGVTTQGSTRWLASAAATAASTYALDAIVTACGIAAVASGALDGLGTSVVVGLLGLSYVGWLAGLVSAMRANVALVDRTGLSTDVVSKAAYDLARRRSGGDRRPGSRPPAVMSRPRPPRRCPTSSGRSGHVFAVADVADEIDLAEHLPANRARVRRWLDAAPGAHDWRPFVRHTLRCEGLAEPSPIDIQRRESLTRKRVLEGAWGPGSTSVAAFELSDQPAHGYAGIVLASATRPLSDPSAGPARQPAAAGRARAHIVRPPSPERTAVHAFGWTPRGMAST